MKKILTLADFCPKVEQLEMIINMFCWKFIVLGLECSAPSSKPTSVVEFKSICGKAGKDAKCCSVSPVSGLEMLCQDAF